MTTPTLRGKSVSCLKRSTRSAENVEEEENVFVGKRCLPVLIPVQQYPNDDTVLFDSFRRTVRLRWRFCRRNRLRWRTKCTN